MRKDSLSVWTVCKENPSLKFSIYTCDMVYVKASHTVYACVNRCMAYHAQNLKSGLHAWLQNFEAYQTTWKQEKKKMISLIFTIHASLIIALPMMWIMLKSWCINLQHYFVDITFLLYWKINTWVLGTNVSSNWLHGSPVSGYTHEVYWCEMAFKLNCFGSFQPNSPAWHTFITP